MKSALKLSSAFAAVAILGAGGSAAWAEDAAAKSNETDASAFGDIVVTATRREESANKVPVALQALGSKQLEELKITNFDKLVEYLPNVRSASTGPGVTTIYIRGLSTDQAGIQIAGVAGVQPNVALYLNDMPASSPGRNLDVHATDLQRVEVLAGPQGTLFGASAMGGAIRYITNKPDLNAFHAGLSASGSATKHGTGSYSVEGFINIPIVEDKFGIRIAAYNDYQGGYIDNVPGSYQMPWNPGGPGVLPSGNPTLVAQAIQSCAGVVNCVATATGTTGGYIVPTRQTAFNSSAVKDNFNDATYAGGRIAATWKINDDWSLDVMAMHQTLKTDGVFSYMPSVGELKTVQFSQPSLRDTIDAATLTLKGRLGILDLIYTGSYLNHHSVQHGDYARYDNIGAYVAYYQCDRGVYYSGYANSYRQGNTCYAPTSTYVVDDTNLRQTHEFRITTPADKPLRATLGFFYDKNILKDVTNWLYTLPAAGFIYSLTPNPLTNVTNTGALPPGSGFVNTIRRTDDQKAIYGEVSFDVIPNKLTLTGGARYYSETAGLYGGSNTSFGGVRAICNPAPGTGTSPSNPAVCNYTAAATPPQYLGASSVLSQRLAGINPHTYNGFIFKGNINYKINDRSIIYATYSQGYRPGGFNRRGCAGNGVSKFGATICDANRAYAPDKNYNYEIGTKLNIDNQVQINLAAYIINWKNVLMSVFDENISNQTFINNLGNARIHGIEGDIMFRPRQLSGLTVNVGFSYNDTKFLGAADNPIAKLLSEQGVLMPAGSPLGMSPKFQGNIRARYEWETGSGLKPFVSAGVHHVSSSITSDVKATDILYAGCGSVSPYPGASTCGTGPQVINGVAVTKGMTIAPVPVSFNLPGYTTFEASIGVSRDNWSVEVFGDNISDARPQIYAGANDGIKQVTTARPRTFGLRVNYKM